MSRIPAWRIADGEEVLLGKRCPKHGFFQALIWRGDPSYDSWSRPKRPERPATLQTTTQRGCPWDCGLCSDHRQQTCCTLLEVTSRCDLKCPVCFANSGSDNQADPDLSSIVSMYERLMRACGPCNVQISGGEPTVREDLPEIIALGRSVGFGFLQLNTNGLRLARDPSYVKKLKDAGLSCVFLQFDGLKNDVLVRLRGRPLAREKDQAVANCLEHDLGVVLVPTLVPGVNLDLIGSIIEYAKARIPGVRGVHFQPVCYFGRYSGLSPDQPRVTIPEVISEIERQTAGAIKKEHFRPPGAEHSHCSFHANFVLMPGEELKPWTVHDPENSCCGAQSAESGVSRARQFQKNYWALPASPCCSPAEAPGLGGWDTFVKRLRTHSFCISGMAFQDAWTLDLDRLKECHLHVLHPDGRLIPFCAYNLTDRRGRSFYRP
jgi:hypothetical protein